VPFYLNEYEAESIMTGESWLLEKAECKPHANYTLKCSLMGTQCSCLAINKFCIIKWILYLLELGELLYRMWGFPHFNTFDCTQMYVYAFGTK